jgi:hypothetical protein
MIIFISAADFIRFHQFSDVPAGSNLGPNIRKASKSHASAAWRERLGPGMSRIVAVAIHIASKQEMQNDLNANNYS